MVKQQQESKQYRIKWRRQKDFSGMPLLWYGFFVVAIPYIVWRSTIVNWASWHGPIMYVAELYGVVTTGLFLFVTKKVFIPIPHSTKHKRTVDVLIPTYSEPLAILEPVVLGATNIRGVNKVFVLDDGNRPEVASMAKRLGVRYYARTTNLHAKAGNMNNGLVHSKADFFISLDADHIPLKSFIEETIGYFDDPQLAFVQSPQTFYNTEAFLFRKRRGKQDWSEQIMFYDCLQPAKNNWNAAFFVGTSAILRRAALDAVGGFATGTATEDIHTSLRLHAAGWQSLFLPKPLAYGLEAENFKEFYKQRRRWAAGSLGLLFRSPDSPLRARGLTLAQRLNYLSACLAHLQGVQKICFLLVPVITVFTNVSPVRGNLSYYILFLGLYFIFAIAATKAYSRGTYHVVYTEMFALTNILAHLGGLKGILKVQRKFAVSTKSSVRQDGQGLIRTMWGLSGLSAAAVIWAVVTFTLYHRQALLTAACILFISINYALIVTFLVKLRSYEREDTPAQYVDFVPSDKYHYITRLAPTTSSL
jgi:cellulose synthase/poly-beta-1,6-N-acetylglucosamine synthase-like glycosyltransferase